MKKKIFMLLVFITIFIPSSYAYAKDIDDKSMQDFILSFLANSIHQAVNEYYGDEQTFDLYGTKILEIKPLNEGKYFSSEIKVEIITYTGAHNPPHGVDTITMIQEFTDIKVIKFEHKELKSDRKIQQSN